jgi:hypothetical protein
MQARPDHEHNRGDLQHGYAPHLIERRIPGCKLTAEGQVCHVCKRQRHFSVTALDGVNVRHGSGAVNRLDRHILQALPKRMRDLFSEG